MPECSEVQMFLKMPSEQSQYITLHVVMSPNKESQTCYSVRQVIERDAIY
jgi:hypothetical protein